MVDCPRFFRSKGFLWSTGICAALWGVVSLLMLIFFIAVFPAVLRHEVLKKVNLHDPDSVAMKKFVSQSDPKKKAGNRVLSLSVYNLKNADDWFQKGAKPELELLGPFEYAYTWKRSSFKGNDPSNKPGKDLVDLGDQEIADVLRYREQINYHYLPSVKYPDDTKVSVTGPNLVFQGLFAQLDKVGMPNGVKIYFPELQTAGNDQKVMIATKTVNELLFGYPDPAFDKVPSNLAPRTMGGFRVNMTLDNVTRPEGRWMQMDTGKLDSDNLAIQTQYMNMTQVQICGNTYMPGQPCPDGGELRMPYDTLAASAVSGSWGVQYPPLRQKHFDPKKLNDDSNRINVFVPDLLRSVSLKYTGEHSYALPASEDDSFSYDPVPVWRYELDNAYWIANNTINAPYSMTKGNYLFNVGSFHMYTPLWVSKQCFKDRLDLLAEVANQTAKACMARLKGEQESLSLRKDGVEYDDYANGNADYDDSKIAGSLTGQDFYVDVEPYTGFAFKSSVKMQLNIQIGPLTYDDPVTNAPTTFGKSLKPMLYPMLQITDGGSAGKEDVALYNDSIKLAFDGRTIAYTVTTVFFAVFLGFYVMSAMLVKRHYGSLWSPDRDTSLENLVDGMDQPNVNQQRANVPMLGQSEPNQRV